MGLLGCSKCRSIKEYESKRIRGGAKRVERGKEDVTMASVILLAWRWVQAECVEPTPPANTANQQELRGEGAQKGCVCLVKGCSWEHGAGRSYLVLAFKEVLSHRSSLGRLILFWRCPGEGNSLMPHLGEEDSDLTDLIVKFLPASLASRFYNYKVSYI